MTISSISTRRTSTYIWTISWTATTAGPFYVWRNGVLIKTTTYTTCLIAIDPGTSISIDVFDDATSVPSIDNGGYETLCWYAATEATEYLIERYNGATWDEVATIKPSGNGFESYVTGYETDGSVCAYRVSAFDAAENQGAFQAFDWISIHAPENPMVVYTYNGATKHLTIGQA